MTYKCPYCAEALTMQDRGLRCPTCGLYVPGKIAGRQITPGDLRRLFALGHSVYPKWYRDSKKSFQAILVLQGRTVHLEHINKEPAPYVGVSKLDGGYVEIFAGPPFRITRHVQFSEVNPICQQLLGLILACDWMKFYSNESVGAQIPLTVYVSDWALCNMLRGQDAKISKDKDVEAVLTLFRTAVQDFSLKIKFREPKTEHFIPKLPNKAGIFSHIAYTVSKLADGSIQLRAEKEYLPFEASLRVKFGECRDRRANKPTWIIPKSFESEFWQWSTEVSRQLFVTVDQKLNEKEA